MTFESGLTGLAERAVTLKDKLGTEEAVKLALIQPFIGVLGYDFWNPEDVVPEYGAGFGDSRGPRVDYAIMSQGKPVMLIECKQVDDALDNAPKSQLMGYFAASDCRIGVLTNGIVYKFLVIWMNATRWIGLRSWWWICWTWMMGRWRSWVSLRSRRLIWTGRWRRRRF